MTSGVGSYRQSRSAKRMSGCDDSVYSVGSPTSAKDWHVCSSLSSDILTNVVAVLRFSCVSVGGIWALCIAKWHDKENQYQKDNNCTVPLHFLMIDKTHSFVMEKGRTSVKAVWQMPLTRQRKSEASSEPRVMSLEGVCSSNLKLQDRARHLLTLLHLHIMRLHALCTFTLVRNTYVVVSDSSLTMLICHSARAL